MKTYNYRKIKRILNFSILALIIISFTKVGVFGAQVVNVPVRPIIFEEDDIPIGSTYNVYYDLDEGKQYHIFLVGDWIESNESNTRTDYDIYTYIPSNYYLEDTIHTESAAFPEQVANDHRHHYYVPSMSGKHKFEIHNDPEDSNGTESAIFMAIEHINTNTVYSKYLRGRDRPGQDYDPEKNSWAYEFETVAEEFKICVKVPETLDMYEVRLYPMAYPSGEKGYDLSGIGVPFGEYLNPSVEPSDDFGGFNTDIKGYRKQVASCEYYGEDMIIPVVRDELISPENVTEIDEDDDKSVTEKESTFYFLAFLAEYQEGEIEFYIKTDFIDPNVTLVDPPTVGYIHEETLIKVDVDDHSSLDQVWVSYSNDDWATHENLTLEYDEGLYVGEIPSFGLHDIVEYKVYARDSVDNLGSVEGSFEVWDKAYITCGISKTTLLGGEQEKIIGSIDLGRVPLVLNISHNDFKREIKIVSEETGDFVYDYTPPKEGKYTLTVVYEGDEEHYITTSAPKTFTMVKRELDITVSLDRNPAKKEVPLIISGSVSPPTMGVILDMVLVSPEESYIETVTTNSQGNYMVSITPDSIGEWELLPQSKESDLFLPSQGDYIQFEVSKLTIMDLVYLRAMMLTTPPYLYFVIGAFGVSLIGVELKTKVFTSLINSIKGKKPEDEDVAEEIEEKLSKDGATTYKRRSSR